MKRRSPLQNKTPLCRRTPLSAKAAAGKPGRSRGVPVDTRTALAVRSGGRCEAALASCLGSATQAHHRITQKAGGRHGAAKERHDALANLLHLCEVCHAWITTRPTESLEVGLALREWHVPAQEPVLYRGTTVYLDDLGQVLDFEEVGP